jgi:pSer/pThr/pTyr-binding forkhead associated (FHA) protein
MPAAAPQAAPAPRPVAVAPQIAPAPRPAVAPPAAQTPAPRFDAATGAALGDTDKPAPKTMFFGALQQQPVVPRLVLIKGERGDGATYHLQGVTTILGRSRGDIVFGEDPFLSPEHARFTAQSGRLFVQDLGSANGVFLRIKQPTPLEANGSFLVGEQLLRLDATPFSDGSPSATGTYYFGSPRPEGAFRVVQLLAGGGEGRICVANGVSLAMGREGCDMVFPDDRFISGRHARLDRRSDDGRVVLTDTGSRNGTFVRIVGAQELVHGDYLFIGQQLLRVEIA